MGAAPDRCFSCRSSRTYGRSTSIDRPTAGPRRAQRRVSRGVAHRLILHVRQQKRVLVRLIEYRNRVAPIAGTLMSAGVLVAITCPVNTGP
jgi:hypothetical protein